MIPVNTPLFLGNEKKYLSECIDSGWVSSEGPFIKKFEDQFAAKLNRKFGVAVSSGSAAIDTAIFALSLKPGDEIIMPTFTIISCTASIVRMGAVPVLVDADLNTWNMRVDEIEQKITKKTKAIMVVHIYGLPVDMDPILDLAKKYDLKIIEDAAEMHGQTYKGKPCGSFGDVSIFSFYSNKNITTGEGGMVLTDNETIAERCRSFRNLCFIPESRFVHHEIGNNFRMTNMQAALGVAQLEQLDFFVKRKHAIGRRYQSQLSAIKEFTLPIAHTPYADNIYWVFGIVVDNKVLKDHIVSELSKKEIGTRPFFWCMHEQPVFLNLGYFRNEKYPNAEKIARTGFYVPSGLGITDEEIDIVCFELTEIIRQYKK